MCLKFNTNQLVNFNLFITPQRVRTEEIVEFLLLLGLSTYIYFTLVLGFSSQEFFFIIITFGFLLGWCNTVIKVGTHYPIRRFIQILLILFFCFLNKSSNFF